MSWGGSQIQRTLLIISSPLHNSGFKCSHDSMIVFFFFFQCPCHFNNRKVVRSPGFFFLILYVCLLNFTVFLSIQVLSLDVSPWGHSVVFSKNGTRLYPLHLKHEQPWVVLPDSTWLHIWLQPYSCFQLLLPLPLSLGLLTFQIHLSAPPTSWVNQHSNHSMEFTNNLSPAASMVKNWSFSAMHHTWVAKKSSRLSVDQLFQPIWHYCTY